jgi:hypothetical protein
LKSKIQEVLEDKLKEQQILNKQKEMELIPVQKQKETIERQID